MILSRMLGAALLRSDAYEDVEADRSATLQAFSHSNSSCCSRWRWSCAEWRRGTWSRELSLE